jgi:RNA-directed DNA polymerase
MARGGRPQQTRQLAFAWDEAGEAQPKPAQGREPLAAPCSAGPDTPGLMTAVVERANMLAALKRVQANKGGPGVDGMTVAQLPGYLREHWRFIRAALLEGRYRPAAIRRVEIPKPGGGVRQLGIPTVVDRLLQQALLQVLEPVFEPTFSAHSYGFRPRRSAHGALAAAKRYVAEGREWVVDLDLEKFFDRVNHDRLMGKLAKRVADQRILRLVRDYLEAGVLVNGVVMERAEGTPQGGPLSPLLSNIVLDELDRELERRGHRFCRYADDCNIYVRSERAGQRVMASVSGFVERKLKLVVNRAKSAVARPSERKFLGYRLTADERGAHLQVAPTSVERFRAKVRELTGRRRGVSLGQMLVELRQYAYGWLSYFRLGEWDSLWRELDGWVRRRVRQYQWVLWKNPRTRRRELHRLGIPWRAAGVGATQPWRASRHPAVHRALNNQYLANLGCPCLETRRAALVAL